MIVAELDVNVAEASEVAHRGNPTSFRAMIMR